MKILERTSSVLDELDDFIEKSKNIKYSTNKWLEFDEFKVYVRKTNRFLFGKIYTSLDIASIEVCEREQRKGICKNFIKRVHDNNPFDVTYIENVLNHYLSDHLERNGWMATGSELPKSYYKLTSFAPTS